MSFDANEDISYDYDDSEPIDDDEIDSILSGESDKKDRRRRNIPELNLYQFLSKKRRLIHFFFKKITFISFFFTFIYNVFWLIIMKITNSDNKLDNYNKFRYIIRRFSYIFLIKAFFILFFPQLLCGSEKGINDFNFSCVFLKSLTSFAMSLYITSKMEKKLNIDKNFKVMEIQNQLYYWINLYYKCEQTYTKGIISFLLIILSAVLFKIAKELWKAIRYSIK